MTNKSRANRVCLLLSRVLEPLRACRWNSLLHAVGSYRFMMEGLFEGILSPDFPPIKSKDHLLSYLQAPHVVWKHALSSTDESYREVGLLPFLAKAFSHNWMSRRSFAAFTLLHTLGAPLREWRYQDPAITDFALQFYTTCLDESMFPGSLLYQAVAGSKDPSDWMLLLRLWKDAGSEHRLQLLKAACIAGSDDQILDLASRSEEQIAKAVEVATLLKGSQDLLILRNELHFYSYAPEFWSNKHVQQSLSAVLQIKNSKFYCRSADEHLVRDTACVLAGMYGSYVKLMDLVWSRNPRATICCWLES